jgi:tetratricopeptide (TPR) repeat protein
MWSLATALLLTLIQAPPDYVAQGMKALEAQKYAEAAGDFTKAIAADPKDYAAHFHLALANSLQGKDAEAIVGYQKVLELKPGLYEAELNLGIVLLRQKQEKEAVPHLEAAAEKKPKEARPKAYLGNAWFDSGDYLKAEQAYANALELDAKSAPAELGLARSLARENKLKESEPHFRKAADLDPSFKSAILELAALYEKGKQPSEAVAIYREFPDNPAARERMGELLIESGNPEQAVPALEDAVQKSPTSANRLALAIAYRRSGHLDKTVATLEQAVKDDPNNLELRMVYGRNLRDARNFQAAARQFYFVAQQKPDSVEAWNELSGMLVSMELYPQAIAALDRVRALGAETAGHFYLRAIVLDKVNDFKGALASYQKFLELSQAKNPDEEFKARQRIRILQNELSKR